MADPDATPHDPHPEPPSAAEERARILDITGFEGTASYSPDGATATFTPPANAEALPTATVGAGPLDDTDPDPAIHLPQITGYRVLRVISRGGMGTVFKAVHITLDKVVALKLINSGWATDNDFLVRFDREAKTLAKLEHPNIVPVYDAGFWQGLPYLTMKFIAGRTLHHHRDRLRQNPRAACEVMAQVAHAVGHLHAQNIIHRDLKPLNILMTPEGVPVVADFGLVRPLGGESDFSLTMMPLGTRPYMSPEQTRGGRENYTAACDIWALGIILYELLSGTRPFASEDHDELFRKIRHDAPPAMVNVPPMLEAIARKCLQKSPADRYETADALAADLERWLAGEDIILPPTEMPAAAPESVPEAAVQPLPRKPRPARLRWAVAALLCVLLGFSGAAPRPVAGTEASVDARMSAGETIRFVPVKGLPRYPTRPTLPGSAVTTDADGYCVMNALTPQAVELYAGELPVPVEVRGRVAVREGQPEVARGGIYVGHQTVDTAAGKVHAAWIVGITPDDPVRVAEGLRVTDRAVLELRFFNERSRANPPLLIDNHLVYSTTRRATDPNHHSLVWNDFRVVVDKNRLEAFCNKDPLLPLAPRDLTRRFDSHRRLSELAEVVFPAPLGVGIGLFAINAEVVFSDVTVRGVGP